MQFLYTIPIYNSCIQFMYAQYNSSIHITIHAYTVQFMYTQYKSYIQIPVYNPFNLPAAQQASRVHREKSLSIGECTEASTKVAAKPGGFNKLSTLSLIGCKYIYTVMWCLPNLHMCLCMRMFRHIFPSPIDGIYTCS